MQRSLSSPPTAGTTNPAGAERRSAGLSAEGYVAKGIAGCHPDCARWPQTDPPEIATQVAEHAGDTKLTPREIEVLKLLAAGNSNKSLAEKLSVSEETVKMHVKNILSKLDANDRTHAVTIAVKRGIMNL
jgi:DNA-binding NarL/FixJ family response regulator